MKRLKQLTILFLLSVACGAAFAQTTVVTATITDSDGFAWIGAKYNVSFVPNPSYPNTNQYTLAGQNLATYAPYNSLLNQNLITNGAGALTVTVLDNTQIQPAGSTWRFTVQSNTSAQATVYQPIQLYGATFILTSYLSSNAVPPRFAAILGAFAYGDVELTTTPNPGGQYFNTTTLTPRYWNGTVWANYGAGGATTINGQTSPYTFNGAVTNTGSTFTFTGSGGGSYTLNLAETGALAAGAVLTHTKHYVVPLGQTTAQNNTLIATDPTATFEFQNGDSVYQGFSNSQAIANVIHDGVFFYTHQVNWDRFGVTCDARSVFTTFSTGSKTIAVTATLMSSLDIGKVFWAWNNSTNTAFESQIVSIPDSGHFIVASFPAFNQASFVPDYVGTDNTTTEQAAITWASTYGTGPQGAGSGNFGPPAKLTLSAGGCMAHTLDPKGASIQGAGVLTNLIGAPGEDIFAAPDAFTTPTSQGASHINDLAITIEGGIDATQNWTLVNDSGSNAKTALYRPAYVKTKNSNDPTSPQWCIGPGANNTGCNNGVALTNATTLICIPSAILASQIPSIGQQVLFPYTSSGLIETTVASNAGSCTGGATPRTLNASIPAASQAEYFFGTNFQHNSVDFPASRTYPLQVTFANPIIPSAGISPTGSESDIAPYGLVQVGTEQCTYYNIAWVANQITVTGCTGTAVDHPIGSFWAPLNPFKPGEPWPVVPSINSNDTTPTNAGFYPGHNIGNCVWAFPQSNGSANQALAWGNAHIENITITQNNLPGYNNTCPFYFVGLAYATHFNDIRINNTEYGPIQAQPSIQNHNFAAFQPTADGSTWTGITVRAGYIFDFINANQNNLSNWDTYSQLGNSSGTSVGCGGGFFTSYGWDDQTGAQVGAMSASETHNMYIEPESGTHCGQEALIEMDGYSNQHFGWHMGGGGYVYINGQDQKWFGGNMNNGQGLGYVAPIINYANGASFYETELVGGSPYCNIFNFQFVSSSCVAINWGPKMHVVSRTDSSGPIGNAVYGNSRTVFDGQTNETFQDGNLASDFFVHSGSGLIDPSEFSAGNFDPAPMNHNLWTFDSTANVTQANVGCNVGNVTTNQYCAPRVFNNNTIYIGPGQRLCACKNLVYINAKSGLATNTINFGFAVTAQPGGAQTILLYNTPQAVTNAWPTTNAGVWQAILDLTPYAGYGIQLLVYGASAADTVYLQYVDFAPLADNLSAKQISVIGTGAPTYTNGVNGTETWQPAAPSGVNGCGSTYPNGSIWHNLAGTAAGVNRFYICDGSTTTWNAKF